MMLRVKGVSFRYRSVPVLEDICFDVNEGELLTILGPNGVGKSTLLKCLNGILKPQSGCILIENDNLLKLHTLEIARRLGYVAQKSESARLTAFDAILLGRRPHIRWSVTEHDLRIVNAAIQRLNLEELSLRYVDEMSGGEFQKVCIARALVQEPKVLLLDEPTASLDLKNQLEILKLIKKVVIEHTISAVMSMHNLNTALRYSDKFLFLKHGTIFAAGKRHDITAEVIEAVYGVHVAIEHYQGHPIIIPVDS